jgi:molecular chaperone HscA
VVATGGDSALGGDDYDHALADWVLAKPVCRS